MYAELNKDKTDIARRYGVGRNPKHTSFSVNSSHEDYTKHGYYQIIDEDQVIPNGKMLGDRTFSVDESAKTVTITRMIVDAPAVVKEATLDSILALLVSKGTITAADVTALKS